MQMFGPYIIGPEIARGGQGVVYQAKHSQLGNIVAIKLLLDDDLRHIKRFRQEAKVLAQLDHPHLPKVLDLGVVNNISYMAMEFIRGTTISDIIKQEGIPSLQWVVDVLTSISNAVAYCHERGILHRDIKPANIVIEDETGRPVLIDFGLVKRDIQKMGFASLDATRMSVTGETKGTPSYMAPEQLDDSFGAVGPSADIYALGSTLYFMLTGQAPFQGATAYNIMVKLLRDDPRDVREINPNISDGLAELCMRTLSKDPLLRPETAHDFVADLRISIRKPRRRRHFRRYAAPAIAGSLLLSGLGAGYLLSQRDRSDPANTLPAPRVKQTPTRATRSQPPPLLESDEPPNPTLPPRPPQEDLPPGSSQENMDSLLRQMDNLKQSGNFDEMKRISNKMIDLNPRFHLAYIYRATASAGFYYRTEDFDRKQRLKKLAIDDLDMALRYAPNQEEADYIRNLRQRVIDGLR